jgi:hypothetical protein
MLTSTGEAKNSGNSVTMVICIGRASVDRALLPGAGTRGRRSATIREPVGNVTP